MNKALLLVVWLIGWVHVIWFSPEINGSMMDFIQAVMQMDTELIDPFVFMVFNLLGVWPLIMVAMLVQDTQGKLKAWPFAFSSMVLGNSALYLYLFFRKEQKPFTGPKTALLRFAESKILAFLILAVTLALLVYGFSQGNVAEFSRAWQENYYVNVMTVDFFLFPIAFACILADDMRRRNMPINGLFWLYALVPILGAVGYLALRAPLADNNEV